MKRENVSTFWFLWIILSSIGYFVGEVLLVFISTNPTLSSESRWLAVGGAQGLAIGFFQWLVLRGQIQKSSWWLPATGLGWSIGLLANKLICAFITNLGGWLVTGIIVSLAQWLVLKAESPSKPRFAVWAAANILSILTVYGLILFSMNTFTAYNDYARLGQVATWLFSFLFFGLLTSAILLVLPKLSVSKIIEGR